MRILIADRQESSLRPLVVQAEKHVENVDTARSPKQLREAVRKEKFDLLLLSTSIHEESEDKPALEAVLEEDPELPVVMIASHAKVEEAVFYMKKGAMDYLQDPLPEGQINRLRQHVERERKLRSRLKDLESRVSLSPPEPELESEEPEVRELYGMALQAATAEANILLLGESGTGKTVLARHIHRHSARASEAFVTIHCPSLSPALLESELFGHVEGAFTGAVRDTWGKVTAAEQGTLFLDEIGQLPLKIQSKLLRLIQERAYERVGETRTRHADVRIIAATNTDLGGQVESGHFREDLLYRLNVVNLRLPALAQRPRDILPVAHDYLDFFATQMGKQSVRFSDEAKAALRNYGWPGNFRELRNLVERAVIFCRNGVIEPRHFSETLSPNPSSQGCAAGDPVTLEELEKEHIRKTLAREKSVRHAAEKLGINAATLYRKRKRYGMDREGSPAPS